MRKPRPTVNMHLPSFLTEQCKPSDSRVSGSVHFPERRLHVVDGGPRGGWRTTWHNACDKCACTGPSYMSVPFLMGVCIRIPASPSPTTLPLISLLEIYCFEFLRKRVLRIPEICTFSITAECYQTFWNNYQQLMALFCPFASFFWPLWTQT